jgi:DNA-3-methyladenine glycosylase I
MAPPPPASQRVRCPWAKGDQYVAYHDTEWGVPVHDDRKRENYREAFDQFDPVLVAKYGKKEQARLLENAGIVRNRLKIESAIDNARFFLDTREEFGTFDAYIWGFVDGQPRQNARGSIEDVPAKTLESDAMSKDLKRRGFRFVGSTICYAFMQAVGMVNDHLVECYRHVELQRRNV